MVDVAVAADADFIGLVFFPPSPRHVSLQDAGDLALRARSRGRSQIVALTVDANDDLLDAIDHAMNPDWFQLHGRETAERTSHIRMRFGKPVIKTIKLATRDDLASAMVYANLADMLLYDAKTEGAVLPGGNGRTFEWDLLRMRPRTGPTMLAGGLNAYNVTDAIHTTEADFVDISSGVERAPGIKDPVMVRNFIATVRRAGEQANRT